MAGASSSAPAPAGRGAELYAQPAAVSAVEPPDIRVPAARSSSGAEQNMNYDKDFSSIWTPRLQSILRIVVAGLFLMHGSAKLLHIPHVPQFDNVQLTSLVGIAGLLELLGGILLLIGMFTRPVAFILSGEMAVAYFMAHQPRGLLPIMNGGELAAIYSFVFLYFAVAGGGLWSVDQRGRARANRPTRRARAAAEFDQRVHEDAEHQL
jgi:putative oxidoreductase